LRQAVKRRLAVLADSLDWATNVGYPGHATAAIEDLGRMAGAQAFLSRRLDPGFPS